MSKLRHILPGLASVTLRGLNPPQVIQLCQQAGLAGIEWDGDAHVPFHDMDKARQVAESTRAQGLQTVGYASYYRVGASERGGMSFARILAVAAELQSPLIRVWAGIKPSAKADEAYVNWVAEESLRIADMAAEQNIQVAYEAHAGTLTDSLASTMNLMAKAEHPNLYFLWQPANGKAAQDNMQTLRRLLPRLANVHVFHWWPDPSARHALEAGSGDWRQYLDLLHRDQRTRYALLEYVKNDDPAQLLADANTLKNWLQN